MSCLFNWPKHFCLVNLEKTFRKSIFQFKKFQVEASYSLVISMCILKFWNPLIFRLFFFFLWKIYSFVYYKIIKRKILALNVNKKMLPFGASIKLVFGRNRNITFSEQRWIFFCQCVLPILPGTVALITFWYDWMRNNQRQKRKSHDIWILKTWTQSKCQWEHQRGKWPCNNWK